jgi:hypothetical protein
LESASVRLLGREILLVQDGRFVLAVVEEVASAVGLRWMAELALVD